MRRCILSLLLIIVYPLLSAAEEKLLPVFHFQRLSMADGLPTDEIRSRVFRDRNGYVWIGTVNGLERYDGYTFKEYRNVRGDPHSLGSNMITSLLLDRKQRLWVGTAETGLSLYDAARDRFLNFLPRPGDSSQYRARFIFSMLEDHSGNLWLGTIEGGVVRVVIPPKVGSDDLDSLAQQLRFETYSLGTRNNSANDLCETDDGKILVAAEGRMFVLDPSDHSLSHTHFANILGRRLDSTSVWRIVRDSYGNLWVGTATDGIYRVDRETGEVVNFRHRKGDSLSIRSDDVWDILDDRRGNLWVATTEGLDLFSPETGKRRPFLTYGAVPAGSIRMRLSVDADGTLWIGTTQDGLYRLSPKSLRFPHYSLRSGSGGLKPFATTERERSGKYWLSSEGAVYHIDIPSLRILKTIEVFDGSSPAFTVLDRSVSLIDDHGNYWYGSAASGLFKVNLSTGQTRNYRYASPSGTDCIVWSIASGPGDSLWTAAYYDGLIKFDPVTGNYTRGSLPLVTGVLRDRHGKMWVATETQGLVVYDPATGVTQRFRHDSFDPRSLSNDRAQKVYEDPSGRIWIGAGNVINLWDPATASFTKYPNPMFEHAILVWPIGSDKRGRLWVGSRGLSILDPSTATYVDFDVSDGVCAEPIDMHSLPDGRVLLTGWAGVNILNPDSLDLRRPSPQLVVTRMAVNDAPVMPPPLVNGYGTLQLSYAQNVLEFEFAAMDIDAPRLVNYRYRLEGLEREWVHPGGRRFVRYPGLPPGDYVFKVKAESSRAEWPEQEIALALSIAPPWWRTAWAYTGYGIVFLAVLFSLRRYDRHRLHLKHQLELQQLAAEKLRELDRVKSRFFANISHEFRTPLTLVLGSLEQAHADVDHRRTNDRLDLAKNNAERLLLMVNQLLDLSRIEARTMNVHATSGDVISLVRRTVYSFESWAETKHIDLALESEAESMYGYFDPEKVEKVLNNLLSNAMKFTPEGGRISVTLRAPNSATRSDIEIKVSDNGIGIAAEHLERVFDRFYRVDETHKTEGTGIGLALTKELVELHHGEIAVESTKGKGTLFTVRLPLDRSAYSDEERSASEVVREPSPPPMGEPSDISVNNAGNQSSVSNEKAIVLMIEDNADLRIYIREYLEAEYDVREARDGTEGYEMALNVIPDIVVSDVMMPGMDGMELCGRLKQDEKTSHIPIILLTARSGSEHRLQGLEIGADDYVIKPFDVRELLARVRNLIHQRQVLRKKFSAGAVLKPGEVAVTSIDDALLKKVISMIEQNIGNENFGVDDLARAAFLSRSQLNRKLQALTDLAPAEFIRYIRLHRAMDLLKNNVGTVAEVAYSVGYSDPSHFSARFKELFGVTPGDIRKQPGGEKA